MSASEVPAYTAPPTYIEETPQGARSLSKLEVKKNEEDIDEEGSVTKVELFPGEESVTSQSPSRPGIVLASQARVDPDDANTPAASIDVAPEVYRDSASQSATSNERKEVRECYERSKSPKRAIAKIIGDPETGRDLGGKNEHLVRIDIAAPDITATAEDVRIEP